MKSITYYYKQGLWSWVAAFKFPGAIAWNILIDHHPPGAEMIWISMSMNKDDFVNGYYSQYWLERSEEINECSGWVLGLAGDVLNVLRSAR